MKELLKSFVLWWLRVWARVAVRVHRPVFIGIAGSAGKSSTRNAIFAILRDTSPTVMIHGNSETGLALGLVGIEPKGYGLRDWVHMLLRAPFGIGYLRGAKYAVVEMGIDGPLPPKNMGYLLTIVKPDIAINLNISATHTQEFEAILTAEQRQLPLEEQRESMLKRMAWEDTRIIRESRCEIGMYNADDTYITEQMEAFKITGSNTVLKRFGGSAEYDCTYTDYSVSVEGTRCTLALASGARVSLHFTNAVLPAVYQEVFCSALLVAEHLGIDPREAARSLEKNYTLPKSRSSLLRGINGSMIIDSSYNACRDAILPFIDMLAELKRTTGRPTLFVLGDIRELGETAKLEMEAVAARMPECADVLYCVGPLTKQFVLPIAEPDSRYKEVKWFPSYRELGEYVRAHMPPNAIVCVKGSQNQLFLEEAIKYILADSRDAAKLCRQEPYWATIKGLTDPTVAASRSNTSVPATSDASTK